MGASARAEYHPEYVRLHVLAEDDTETAQALKLKVRDACLKYAQGLLKNCESADQAWDEVNEHIDELSFAAQFAAETNGFKGEVHAETGVFSFPDRQYGETIVPAGDYRALRIIIGEGEGKNWWCVLYPSMCMPEGYEPGMKVEFYSSIGRWLRQVFGGAGA